MAQTYNLISIAAFFAAGISLVVTMVCWFRFKIPKIMGELSGRTAKKSIAQMREENEKRGREIFHPVPSEVKDIPQITIHKEVTKETGQTELLAYETEILEEERVEQTEFCMIQDIVLIHTDETILH